MKLSVGWSECVQSGQSVLTLFREFRVNLQDKTVPGFHFAETDLLPDSSVAESWEMEVY